MSDVYIDDCGSDIKCPGCGAEWSLGWNTEYGDPYPGQYELRCRNCDTIIKFECEVTSRYRVQEPAPATGQGGGHCSRCSNPVTDAEQMDNGGLCNGCAEKYALGQE